GLEISSEMIAPPKPMMKAKPSSEPMLRPLGPIKRFRPSKLAVIPSTATTAMLVNKNRAIRFILGFSTRGKDQVQNLNLQDEVQVGRFKRCHLSRPGCCDDLVRAHAVLRQ